MEIEFTKHFGKKLVDVALTNPLTSITLSNAIGKETADYCHQLIQIMAGLNEQGCDSFTVIIKTNTDTATNK